MTELLTYKERHERGLDVIKTLRGGAIEPERGARGMRNIYGALGSFGIDYVLGDVWARPQLSRRDRSLIVIAILAAFGRDDELRYHVGAGLNHGLSREEIEEIMLQVAGYAGFPFAIGGMTIASKVFARLDGVDRLPKRAGAAEKDDAQRRADAADVRRTLTGGRADPDPDTDLANMQSILGDVGTLAYHWAFGEVWARDQLSRRDRSLVVVAILTALSKERELRMHVFGAINHGVTREEIEEVMVQMCAYGGFPRAVEGMNTARAAFRRLDEAEKEGPG